MSISRSDDGLPSKSQSPRVIPDDDDKGKQPLVDPHVPQASTSAPPIVETRPRNTTSISHSHDELSSDTESGVVKPIVDYIGKISLEALPMSEALTSGSWSGEIHRQVCKRWFQLFIGPHADFKTSVFDAAEFLPLLMEFGLSPDFMKDDLRDMFKLSGYADENGTIDFKRFTVFAEDFQLVESLRIGGAAIDFSDPLTRSFKFDPRKSSDRGPLGYFFPRLELALILGSFTNNDFIEAFNSLDMKPTVESVDSLVHYADLPTSVIITFDEFVKVLRREDEEYKRRTGQSIVSRRMDYLDKGCRVGRLMAFVSAYSRSDHVVRELARRANLRAVD